MDYDTLRESIIEKVIREVIPKEKLVEDPVFGGESITKQKETFEKCSISFKIKAREDFNRRNILDISRIKI